MFNSRMQPTQIGLGNGVNSQNLLKLDYEYGATASVNNGNVTKQTITVPGVAHPFVQTYAYDELNRLTNAEETQNSVQTWEQTFTYDRFGNRNYDQANTTFAGFDKLCSGNTVLCADLKKKRLDPAINTSNNRLSTSDDYAFDSSGNTTADAEGRTFVYDAENKQVEVIESSTTIGEYFYDGDGRRVKKIAGSEETIFVYDAGGKLIGEYSTIVQTGSNAKTVYTTNDHLGSPRINTDGTGQVISRHDYHPFGEGIERSSFGYGSDTIRKQFTGYERDIESELDFAEARYYNSQHGRFTSIDMGPFTPADPQNWNRYVYTLNNPLKFVDKTGNQIELSGPDAQAFVDYLEKNSGLKLKYKVKDGVIRITGSSQDKNFTGKVNEKFRDVVKSAASASEVEKFEVGRNSTNADGHDVFFDDNGDSWNAARTKDGELRTSKVDLADISDADASAPEFAQALVGHFLQEGIEMRKPGANYEYTYVPGAHAIGLKVEAEIISAATGTKQETRYTPETQNQTPSKFNFVYTTVQYDVAFKSSGISVTKVTPPTVPRPPKKK